MNLLIGIAVALGLCTVMSLGAIVFEYISTDGEFKPFTIFGQCFVSTLAWLFIGAFISVVF